VNQYLVFYQVRDVLEIANAHGIGTTTIYLIPHLKVLMDGMGAIRATALFLELLKMIIKIKYHVVSVICLRLMALLKDKRLKRLVTIIDLG
jgi:hypothetical protein